jgi:hypothetical protein
VSLSLLEAEITGGGSVTPPAHKEVGSDSPINRIKEMHCTSCDKLMYRDEIQSQEGCDFFIRRALRLFVCEINHYHITSPHSSPDLLFIVHSPEYGRCPTLTHRNACELSIKRWEESLSSLH